MPDHATVFSGTSALIFAGRTALEQRFIPRRDRLTAIDVLIAAENADLPGDIQLEVLDGGSRLRLRLSRLPAALAPVGQIWDMRPGQVRERWSSFGFEPIEDSRNRELLFRLTYPMGNDRPGSRLVTLAALPATYPGGGLALNGDLQTGNLLFRLADAGTRRAALEAGLENLARVQPIAGGTLALPVTLTVLCVACAVSVFTRLR